MRLLRTALIAAAFSLSIPTLARAQYELTWHQCAGSPQSVSNKRFDCSLGDSRPLRLVITVTPSTVIKSFVGFQAKLDVTAAGSSLPDWWRLGIGECRDGAIAFPTSVNGMTGCQNPWAGGQTGGGFFWTTGLSGGGSARLSIAFARSTATTLNPGTRYIAGAINIDPTTGSGCGGCDAEMCISLVEVEIGMEMLTANDPSAVTLTRSTGQSVATFNARADNPCGSKVRNKTWGTVKATYR